MAASCAVADHVVHNRKASAVSDIGMFVHAIQGMRPNLVASRWNFTNFQSSAHGCASAVQMGFTTLDTHGRSSGAGSGGVTINVGSLVLGGKLAVVTAETKWPDEVPEESAPVISSMTHCVGPVQDPDTGYGKPTALDFRWAGPSILGVLQGNAPASLYVDVSDFALPKGLIEKVDVLAEIPYVIKTMVN